MRCIWVALVALAVGCDDGGGAGAPDVPVRGPTDAGGLDAGPGGDQRPGDGGGADAEPTPDAGASLTACLAGHPDLVEVVDGAARAATDDEGLAWFVSPDAAAAWRVAVVDAAGAPLVGAHLGLAVGARSWTLVIDPAGQAPTAWTGALAAARVRLDAAAQAVGGVGEGDSEAGGALDGPACLAGARGVAVDSRHVPVGDALTARVARNWQGGPCAQDPASWAETCAAVDAMPAAFPASAGAALALRPARPATYGAAVAAFALDDPALDGCAAPLGRALVTWLPPGVEHPHRRRFGDLRIAYDALLRRLAGDPPPDGAAAAADVVRAYAALALVGGLVGADAVDAVEPAAGGLGRGSFAGAAEAVHAFAEAAGLAAERTLPAPYDALLLRGGALDVESVGLRPAAQSAEAMGLGDALAGCTVPAIATLEGPAATYDVEIAVGHMLDLLEAGLAPLEARWPPPDAGPPDAAPPVDAGVPDAAVRLDAAPPVDAAAPIDAAPPPDAAPDAAPAPDLGPRGPCEADPHEPDDRWQTVVVDGRRHPQNQRVIEGLTLTPGDEDWFSFETPLIALGLTARVEADPHCDGPSERVCVELQYYSWVFELLDDPPEPLGVPVCGDLRDGIQPPGHNRGALTGEPWIGGLLRVYREGDPQTTVPYRVRFFP